MANTLKLEIVTPEAKVFSEDVEMVTLPGVEGEMGILPQHVRLMTQLVPGEMIVRKDGQDRFLAVGQGLVEVTGDRVAIVTDMAVAVENIDEAKAEEARQRAAARLREKVSSEEVASVNAALARSLNCASSDAIASDLKRKLGKPLRAADLIGTAPEPRTYPFSNPAHRFVNLDSSATLTELTRVLLGTDSLL
jgi:F-type H+-transporting ATPase subunit epsilon